MQVSDKKFIFAAVAVAVNIVYQVVSQVENVEFFIAGGTHTHIAPCSKQKNLP